jgi:nitrite reductase (NO-forming)
VRAAQAQAQTTLRLALAFVAAAALAGAATTTSDLGRWLPLHLFLAGGVVLAISGASVLLTVTWSAAPAPADRWVATQRAAVAVGAAGVAVGRELDLPVAVIGAAGVAFVAGLVLLASLLVVTVRQGVERRFDVAVGAYVAALVAGVAAATMGAVLAWGRGPAGLRDAHVTLNLLGLVGLVVAGTLPFFAATAGRTRMAARARPARLAAATGTLVAAVALTATGALLGSHPVTVAGLVAYAVGIVAVLSTLPRAQRRQARWAGPRLAALWVGALWWALAVVATAIGVARGSTGLLADRWVLVLVVAGYGQILWGALAYLLPMLRGGGHERLAEGFAATRSWVGFAAVNVAGGALALGVPAVAPVALAVLVVDGAVRTVRLR